MYSNILFIEMDENYIEKVRERFKQNTVEKDGHVIWPGKNTLIRIALNLDVSIHDAYTRMIEYDQKIVREENTRLSKQCSEDKCISHHIPLHVNLKSYLEMNADDHKHYLNFLEKSSVEEECKNPNVEGKCRTWIKSKSTDGHGRMLMFGKSAMVHRVAFYLNHIGEDIFDNIDDPKYSIYHLCGNKSCINADHLKRGTNKEVQDHFKSIKERKGQRLNETQVKEIIERLCNGEKIVDIAKRYNVPSSIISPIQNGKSWTNLSSDEQKQKMIVKKRKRSTPKKVSKKYKKLKNDMETKTQINVFEFFKNSITVFKDEDGQEHWLWNKYQTVGGYGQVSMNGKKKRAHVISYLLHNNLDNCPKGKIICHECLHKLCIRPEHLRLDTFKANALDKKRDGTELKGESHPLSKITPELAKLIKESKGQGTQEERAKQFGVSQSTVNNIDSNACWKYV